MQRFSADNNSFFIDAYGDYVRFVEAQSRIADLEKQLAEARPDYEIEEPF